MAKKRVLYLEGNANKNNAAYPAYQTIDCTFIIQLEREKCPSISTPVEISTWFSITSTVEVILQMPFFFKCVKNCKKVLTLWDMLLFSTQFSPVPMLKQDFWQRRIFCTCCNEAL